MKHTSRPTQIETILKTIITDYPADTAASLEAYIADLEARTQAIVPSDNNSPSLVPDTSPIWSHERVAKREEKRRERALRKLKYAL
jgi:hypothetical protein